MDITWINHSFHHHFPNDGSMPEDYIPGSGNENDVLQTEKMMLANGIVPSVYFNLPGGTSGPAAFEGAADYGLIGVNTDHLLLPGDGSFVVSANGNERLKVGLFLETLRNNRAQIMPWQWIYFDLSKTSK